MKLAAEIPTAHLEDLSPLFDFDFIIPQKLTDPRYMEFFSDRHDVECIMDNGFHELGRPMTDAELFKFHRLVQPDFLITPDNLDDWRGTIEKAKEYSDKIDPKKLAGNVFGETPGERITMLNTYLDLGFGMICLPYRKRKMGWFDDHAFFIRILEAERLHFLGAIDAHECEMLAGFPHHNMSMDTAKPIKWGIQGEKLNTLKSWSGGWSNYNTWSDAILETFDQVEATLWNIAYLRKVLA